MPWEGAVLPNRRLAPSGEKQPACGTCDTDSILLLVINSTLIPKEEKYIQIHPTQSHTHWGIKECEHGRGPLWGIIISYGLRVYNLSKIKPPTVLLYYGMMVA
jgi:hypothetical protein